MTYHSSNLIFKLCFSPGITLLYDILYDNKEVYISTPLVNYITHYFTVFSTYLTKM